MLTSINSVQILKTRLAVGNSINANEPSISASERSKNASGPTKNARPWEFAQFLEKSVKGCENRAYLCAYLTLEA